MLTFQSEPHIFIYQEHLNGLAETTEELKDGPNIILEYMPTWKSGHFLYVKILFKGGDALCDQVETHDDAWDLFNSDSTIGGA